MCVLPPRNLPRRKLRAPNSPAGARLVVGAAEQMDVERATLSVQRQAARGSKAGGRRTPPAHSKRLLMSSASRRLRRSFLSMPDRRSSQVAGAGGADEEAAAGGGTEPGPPPIPAAATCAVSAAGSAEMGLAQTWALPPPPARPPSALLAESPAHSAAAVASPPLHSPLSASNNSDGKTIMSNGPAPGPDEPRRRSRGAELPASRLTRGRVQCGGMVQRSRRGRRRACCTARCSAARSLRPGRRHAAPEPVARVEGRIGRRHDVRACAPCHASEAVRVRSKLRVRPIRCPVPGHVPGRVHGHVPGHVLGHVRRGLGLFWREDKRAPGQICAARAASSAGAHRVQVACGEALLQLRVGAAGWRGSGERATAARELGAGVGAGHWRAWGRGRSRERPGRPAHRARRCNTRGGLEGRTRVGVGRRRRRSRRLLNPRFRP
eukprot:scaffold35059_cov96-Isochrysis_galbana.AAC.3